MYNCNANQRNLPTLGQTWQILEVIHLNPKVNTAETNVLFSIHISNLTGNDSSMHI